MTDFTPATDRYARRSVFAWPSRLFFAGVAFVPGRIRGGKFFSGRLVLLSGFGREQFGDRLHDSFGVGVEALVSQFDRFSYSRRHMRSVSEVEHTNANLISL